MGNCPETEFIYCSHLTAVENALWRLLEGKPLHRRVMSGLLLCLFDLKGQKRVMQVIKKNPQTLSFLVSLIYRHNFSGSKDDAASEQA